MNLTKHLSQLRPFAKADKKKRRLLEQSQTLASDALYKALQVKRKKIINSVLAAYSKATTKAHISRMIKTGPNPSEEINLIMQEIELYGLSESLGDEIKTYLVTVFEGAGIASLREVATGSISVQTDLISERAVTFANESSATLVTNIDESTMNMIRQKITTALNTDAASYELATSLESLFDQTRADLIASYELGTAYEGGTIEGWRHSGVVTGKQWLTAGDAIVSDACSMNAAQGIIPLENPFQSGHDHPLAHPHCRCSIIAAV